MFDVQQRRVFLFALLSLAAGCAALSDGPPEAVEQQREIAQTAHALVCNPNLPTRPCASGNCPPGPPACGPGSENYPHATVRVTANVPYNAWGDHYSLYEPESPAPARAPVIFYFHGWAGVEPRYYDDFLTHLARRGYVAVFVMYGNAWAPGAYEGNARTAINAVLTELNGPNGHVQPELDPATSRPRIGFAGHSLGGVLALRLAATASTAPAVPQPQAIVLHDASTDIWDDPDPTTTSLLNLIPASTYLMVIRAEQYDAVNNYSLPAWSGTTQIPRARKNLLSPRGDSFGNPDLVSNHFSPGADPENGGDPLDAMDFWGYWRPSEGAFNAAFARTAQNEGYVPFCSTSGSTCNVVRNMGTWLNSTTPVNPALNAADLGL
jgi:acetyl esterase/lipase